MMKVAVGPGTPSTWGVPERLFEGPYLFSNGPRHFDIARDGKRFVMIKHDAAAQGGALPGIAIVQNWFEELNARVPVTK